MSSARRSPMCLAYPLSRRYSQPTSITPASFKQPSQGAGAPESAAAKIEVQHLVGRAPLWSVLHPFGACGQRMTLEKCELVGHLAGGLRGGERNRDEDHASSRRGERKRNGKPDCRVPPRHSITVLPSLRR